MYAEAIREAKATLELNPKYPIAWLSLGMTYLDLGMVEEAIDAHENLRGNAFWGFALAATLASAGKDENAADILEFVENKANNPFTLALIYGGLGDAEQTLTQLEAAKKAHIPWFPWQVAWYPQTKFLRDDPRMQQFADELGIEL